MSLTSNKHSRLFFTVALQRLEDAPLLLKWHRTTAAVYLAGYAVECGMKALLLSRTPPGKQDALLGQFRGNKGHNLEWLRAETTKRKIHLPPIQMAHFRRVNTWSTNLRYQAGRIPPTDARAIIASTVAIVEWITTTGRS